MPDIIPGGGAEGGDKPWLAWPQYHVACVCIYLSVTFYTVAECPNVLRWFLMRWLPERTTTLC